MWSLGPGDAALRSEIEQFRRDADNEIQQISYHIASLNNIEFGNKIQEHFLLSIQKYSKNHGASPYYLHYLLKEHNLYFIAVLFSMINTSKTQEFQHRFCMLAEFLCKGCWSFADQLSFLKLINILLTHSQHLNALIVSHQTDQNDDDNPSDLHQINVQNEQFMIYHNLIQWIQNLAVNDKYKNVNENVYASKEHNKYHSHSYPDLDRDRIFDFINLMVLHRSDIFYKLISFLELARTITNETDDAQRASDEETEAMRVYLGQIYYAHFMESMLPIMVDSPALYVAFIGQILKFGFRALAKDIIEKFEVTPTFTQRVQQMPLINAVHMYITQYLQKVHELISYLAMNRNQPQVTMTTMADPMNMKRSKAQKQKHRHKLRMSDSEILFEANNLLMDLIEFIDYFDDDDVIECLQSVIPSKLDPNDADNDHKQAEMDRLDLRYHRSICYTNLSAIAMIEQDFENVMEYAMKALDNDLKNIQSHRYLIAALLITLDAYKKHTNPPHDAQPKMHFHPTKADVQKALRLMLEVDHKHPFGLEVQQFMNSNVNANADWDAMLKVLNCKRRLYGRYSISPKYRPGGRCLHSSTALNSHELIVFGGMRYNEWKDGLNIYHDLWTLDVLNNEWQLRIPYNGSPNGRFDHSAYVIHDSLFIVIGGKMNRHLHMLPSDTRYKTYNDHEDDMDLDDKWLMNNKETDGLMHRLLFGEYEYNLCDIYDIKRNIWYSSMDHGGECPSLEYLSHHISICVGNKIYIFPVGSTLMYIMEIKQDSTTVTVHWQRLNLSVMIPSHATLMMNDAKDAIQLISMWNKSIKSPKTIVSIHLHSLQCVQPKESVTDPLVHDIEYFAHFNHALSIGNTKYHLQMVHGGACCDTLRGMTVPQLFDCNGRIYREFVLNVTNKIRLIAHIHHKNKKNEKDMQWIWIGNDIRLNDFMDIPSLYGHRMTAIGNDVVITGGIQNETGQIEYSETFCFVIPSMDKIIESAIHKYNHILSQKYAKATSNKTYSQQHRKPPQSSHARFKTNKNKNYKNKQKHKQQKKGNKNKKQKSKGKGKGKKAQPQQQLIRQNNVRQTQMSQNTVWKEITKALSAESIKINTTDGGDTNKWILDISMCAFCYIFEIYSSKNKWVKHKKNSVLHWFCSSECQNQFKRQQQMIQQQLKQYQQQQQQHNLPHAAE